MNKAETLEIMAILRVAYPSYYRDISATDAEIAANLWREMFADDPAEQVKFAVQSLIVTDTKGYPPNIGAVKEKLRQLREPETMTEQEAWGLVSQAIRNSGYSSREEFDKLPPVLQRLVGSPNQLREWATMDSETVASVIASNFQRSYRDRAKEIRDYAKLPQSIRDLSARLASGMTLEALTDGGDENGR